MQTYKTGGKCYNNYHKIPYTNIANKIVLRDRS